MNNIGYRNLLIQYIDRQEADQPIFTTQITQYVARETGLDEADVKKAVNVNMARLERADKILRIEKGVYCKKIKTAFGYYTPNRETLFCRQLLYDEDDVIGYETGLSVLNRLGLMSQMPKGKCIAAFLSLQGFRHNLLSWLYFRPAACGGSLKRNRTPWREKQGLLIILLICTFMYSGYVLCCLVSFYAPSIFFASCVMICSPYCSRNFWVNASIACGEDSSCFIMASGFGMELFSSPCRLRSTERISGLE